MKLISSTRTLELPNYARDGLQRLDSLMAAKNYPLAGNMYVDFFSKRGGWKITFDTLSAADYSSLRGLYDDQFTNEEFLRFDRTGLSGDIEYVFLNLPGESNIVWDQSAVLGLQIILEPRDASN